MDKNGLQFNATPPQTFQPWKRIWLQILDPRDQSARAPLHCLPPPLGCFCIPSSFSSASLALLLSFYRTPCPALPCPGLSCSISSHYSPFVCFTLRKDPFSLCLHLAIICSIIWSSFERAHTLSLSRRPSALLISFCPRAQRSLLYSLLLPLPRHLHILCLYCVFALNWSFLWLASVGFDFCWLHLIMTPCCVD